MSNGSPSVVSLDAHTTRFSPSRWAAENTAWVLGAFTRHTSLAGACAGDGIAARWTTASIPGSVSPPLERLQRLAEVGEIGTQERDRILRVVGLGRAHLVDVEDLVAAREQVTDDDAAGLAAASGDCDLGHALSHSRPGCEPPRHRAPR